MMYGPFKIGNKHIFQSNYFFDNSLKMQNGDWGVRNIEDVCYEGKKNGFLQENYKYAFK